MILEIGDVVKIKGQDDPKLYTIIGAKGLFYQLQTAIDGAAIELKRENELELISRGKVLSSFRDSGTFQ